MTSRRNVANQKSYVIIIARKEGGAWERIIINAPQAVDLGEGQGTAEVNGTGPSAMVVEKDVVGPFSHGGGERQCRHFTHGYRGWALRTK